MLEEESLEIELTKMLNTLRVQMINDHCKYSPSSNSMLDKVRENQFFGDIQQRSKLPVPGAQEDTCKDTLYATATDNKFRRYAVDPEVLKSIDVSNWHSGSTF